VDYFITKFYFYFLGTNPEHSFSYVTLSLRFTQIIFITIVLNKVVRASVKKRLILNLI